jgi:hypothetical protein
MATPRRANPRKGSNAKTTGRPPEIDKQLRPGVTVADQIVQSIGAGSYFEQACAAAGVGRNTGLRWLRAGAIAAKRVEVQDGDETAADLNQNDVRYLAFWRAVTEAEARWEIVATTTLEQLGRGGLTKTVETVKYDAKGNVAGKTVRTETLPPDPAVIMWRLERKHPDRYGRRVEIVGGIPDPLNRGDRLDLLGDELEKLLTDAAETDDSTSVDG